jgi:hypothetical protein
MIYALLQSSLPDADRQEIAQAVLDQDPVVLEQHETNGHIIHIMDVGDPPRPAFFCIWCLDQVRATRRNAPCDSPLPWFFEHRNNADCLGNERSIEGGSYLNPANQGCYVQMGCEGDPAWTRHNCQCIQGGATYCHRAANPGPALGGGPETDVPCVPPTS